MAVCREEDKAAVSFTKTPVLRYLDHFIALKCAPALLTMGLFRNAAEITESMAAANAIRRHVLGNIPQASTTNSLPPRYGCYEGFDDAVVCVGDGYRPQTAALLAYVLPKSWSVLSVDPMLEYDSYTQQQYAHKESRTEVEHIDAWKTVQRLYMTRAKIQNIQILARRVIFVLVHAHVSVEDCLMSVAPDCSVVGFVTMPCCDWAEKQTHLLGCTPNVEFVDNSIASEKNAVRVWSRADGWTAPVATLPPHPSGKVTVMTAVSPESLKPGFAGSRTPSALATLLHETLQKHFDAPDGTLSYTLRVFGRVSAVRSYSTITFVDVVDADIASDSVDLAEYLPRYHHSCRLHHNIGKGKGSRSLPGKIQLSAGVAVDGVPLRWFQKLAVGDVISAVVSLDISEYLMEYTTKDAALSNISRFRFGVKEQDVQPLLAQNIDVVSASSTPVLHATAPSVCWQRRECDYEGGKATAAHPSDGKVLAGCSETCASAER